MDRNLRRPVSFLLSALSLSARRAWIEIGTAWVQEFPELVALRKESVDRNWLGVYVRIERSYVALRKESVDRNALRSGNGIKPPYVALRKESVDRNLLFIVEVIQQ